MSGAVPRQGSTPSRRPAPRLPGALVALLVLPALLGGLSSCSVKKFAANGVANSLTSGPDVFGTEEDPQLVRDAIPFGLKTMESLHLTIPKHRGLLLALCQGFTQYAAAFVQADADEIEPLDYEQASVTRDRALKLFIRARDYGLRGLELEHRGFRKRLLVRPDSAAREIRVKEVPMLYWTAAAWGSAINLGKDRADLLADLGTIRALMRRGLELDEGFDGGAFHEAMIILEALPEDMGGSPERARAHYQRALDLSQGKKVSPHVTLAQTVSVQEQNRREFRALLEKALAIDPDADRSRRLATLVLQRRARLLLSREDDLFLEPADANPKEPK